MLIPNKYVYIRLEIKNHFPKHYVQLKAILNKASLGFWGFIHIHMYKHMYKKFLYIYTYIKYIR